MRQSVRLAIALFVMTAAWSGWAQPVRLDDSASPRAQVQTEWSRAQPLDAHTLRVPMGRVDYRLATAAYSGQRARIFYVVPANIAGLRSPAGLLVNWRGSQFASGSARPGQRVSVWSGRVPGPWMDESLDLEFIIDPRHWRLPAGQSIRFESYFEMEPLP